MTAGENKPNEPDPGGGAGAAALEAELFYAEECREQAHAEGAALGARIWERRANALREMLAALRAGNDERTSGGKP